MRVAPKRGKRERGIGIRKGLLKVKKDYQEQDEKGKAKGGPKTMTWNIAENIK